MWIETTNNPNCEAHRFNYSIEIAHELATQVKGISDIKVWYDANEDFMRIDFKLDGHEFKTRSYKVFAISRNARSFETDFTVPYRHNLVDFFAYGNHLTYTGWRN